jgi:vancomycin resistance protein YoaR
VADQQHDQQAGADQTTVVIPTAVPWPSAEPDAPTTPHQGHIDYLNTLDERGERKQAPPHDIDPPTALAGPPEPPMQPEPEPERLEPEASEPPEPAGPPTADEDQPPQRRHLIRRGVLVGTAAVGLLTLLYCADLVLAHGQVPRGVTVVGVEIGGLDRATAEQRLRDQLEPRLTQPIDVRAGDAQATVDPTQAGLELDWAATLDQAGDQPLNPWTRLRSLFDHREVGIVTRTDPARLASAIEGLRALTDREPSEGAIRFHGITPVPVDPRPGQRLDAAGAADALVAGWMSGRTVDLPVTVTPVRSTAEGVRAAFANIAVPAVSGPVTITGDGDEATLTSEMIAGALTFEVAVDGTLTPKYDIDKIIEALRPQLAGTEKPGKDATVVLEGGSPVVKPSADGRVVDWPASLATLPDVLRGAKNRSIAATYVHQPAKFTTEQAKALGIREKIGEFTTRGFVSDSGVNIRTIAAKVNGALIKPGEQFSLNSYTGPRSAAQGYIEAAVIEKGRPSRAIGGGCSQFATTLYNASYFAGMTDIAHKEHSFYISRYPEAREATVYEGAIDLVFRNDAPTGALIETIWTPSSITVRIWGTKHYEVESITGERTNFTNPDTVTVPYGEQCTPGSGAQGFTATNTRVVRDARTKAELKRTTRTVVYNPLPNIVCAPAPPEQGPPPGG